MAIGYNNRIVRRFKASVTITKYQVVKADTTAGFIQIAGDENQPLGIAMEAANKNAYLDVCTHGVYKATAAAVLTRLGDGNDLNLACAADGEIKTADSTCPYTLGQLDASQASAVTDDIVLVSINKNVVSIA